MAKIKSSRITAPTMTCRLPLMTIDDVAYYYGVTVTILDEVSVSMQVVRLSDDDYYREKYGYPFDNKYEGAFHGINIPDLITRAKNAPDPVLHAEHTGDPILYKQAALLYGFWCSVIRADKKLEEPSYSEEYHNDMIPILSLPEQISPMPILVEFIKAAATALTYLDYNRPPAIIH